VTQLKTNSIANAGNKIITFQAYRVQ